LVGTNEVTRLLGCVRSDQFGSAASEQTAASSGELEQPGSNCGGWWGGSPFDIAGAAMRPSTTQPINSRRVVKSVEPIIFASCQQLVYKENP